MLGSNIWLKRRLTVSSIRIDQLKDALSTDFIEVDGVTVYTPEGQPEGIVTIKLKKWEGHAVINYIDISLKFSDARALSSQLASALKHLDTQLYVMKEKQK